MNITEKAFKVSSLVEDGRTPHDVFLKLLEEVGELAIEIRILTGSEKPSKGGKDGVIGEINDCIITLQDLAAKLVEAHPDSFTEQVTPEFMDANHATKLQKWMISKGYTNAQAYNTLR